MFVSLSSIPYLLTSLRFNIYIYDYCNKRGFRKTARELLSEAEIPADSSPPIDARQGLLFELVFWFFLSASLTTLRWWSVFWVLFTAKNNGSGPEDALVYTQVRSTAPCLARRVRPRMAAPTTTS